MLIPSSRYPKQVVAGDPNMPWGRARNVFSSGDGRGTSWEADLINDLFGRVQAVMAAAAVFNPAIVPDGTVDSVSASQFMAALLEVMKPRPRCFVAVASTDGSAAAPGDKFVYSAINHSGGFVHSWPVGADGPRITVPEAGFYRATFYANCRTDLPSSPDRQQIFVNLLKGDANTKIGQFEGTRHGGSASTQLVVYGDIYFQITDPATEFLQLQAGTGGNIETLVVSLPYSNFFSLEQIGRGSA